MDCLDDNEIAEILAGRLTVPGRGSIEDHLDACAPCRELVALALRGGHGESAASATPSHLEVADTSMALDSEELAAGRVSGPTQLAEPGAEIGHFVVMRSLGRGGMGEVFLARDARLGRRVALKLLHPHLCGTREAVRRFEREARVTAAFDHPNIVRIYAVGEHGGRPYVALQYLEGENLRVRLARGRLGHGAALRILGAIAEALAEAHRHGVLHRDLKPSNVHVGTDGQIRVLDFGLAKIVAAADLAPARPAIAPAAAEAATGMAGTPRYMAPEQWRAEATTGATDVWAWGMMAHELLAGVLPFADLGLEELRERVCDDAPMPALPSSVTAEVATLVAAALSKRPEERPSAERLVRIVAGCLADRPEPREDNPFRGLLAFTEEHADSFFGRGVEIALMVEQLRDRPTIAVVGASGAGKSSFVRAGVIPRLREERPWTVLAVRPGSRPLHALAARLLQQRGSVEAPSELWPRSTTAAELAEALFHQPKRVCLMLRELAVAASTHVLLLVDQLEELFTHTEEEPFGSIEEVRRRFIEAVCDAADDPHDPTRVVLTLRDDFLGRAAVAPALRSRQVAIIPLPTPDATALRDTLVQPVRRRGYEYDDPTLVDDMVAAVAHAPVSLPHLQFVAHALWEARDEQAHLVRRAAYARIGGVQGALARHADGVLAGMPKAEVEVARKLLLALVTPERTRRRVARSWLIEGLGSDDEADVAAVLARLTEARLVSVGRGADDSASVELAHESLVESWSTLRRWLDDDAELIVFLAEVRDTADRWHERGRRDDELWRGDVLADALRRRRRFDAMLPDRARAFLDAGQARERRGRRRRRALVASALAVFALASAVLAWQKREADYRKSQAEGERAVALQEAAAAAWEQGEALQARTKLRMAMEIQDTAASRAFWWRLSENPLIWQKELDAYVYDVDFAADGRRVAAAAQNGALYLIEVATRATRSLHRDDTQKFSVAFAPDGGVVACGGERGEVTLWDPETGALVGVLQGHEAGVRALAYGPDGHHLMSASLDGTVRIWDARERRELSVLHRGREGVASAAFSPDGRHIAAADLAGRLLLWPWSDGKAGQARPLAGHPKAIRALAFSADSSRLASASMDGTARIWRVGDGKLERELSGHTRGVLGVDFHPNGEHLVTASSDTRLRLWATATGRLEAVLDGHRGQIYAARFSSDGTRLVSGGWDATVRLVSTGAALRPRPPEPHQGPVYGLDASRDGRWLASTGTDGTVRVWDAAEGRVRRVLEGHRGDGYGVAFSPDGALLASSGSDSTVRIWSHESGAQLRELHGHSGIVYDVEFHPDGRRLASTGADGSVRLWQVDDGALLRTWSSGEGMVFSLGFSSDGRQLATAGYDGRLRAWNVESGELVRQIEVGDMLYGLAFQPGTSLLAVGGRSRQVALVGPDDGTPRLLGAHDETVHGLAFAPTGPLLATAGADGAVRIWSIDRGLRHAVSRHRREANEVAFFAAGTRVASVSDDETVATWDAVTGERYWRGAVLLPDPPVMSTHRGWEALEPGAAVPPVLEQAVAGGVRGASVSADAAFVCALGGDDRILAWNVRERRVQAQATAAGALRVWSTPLGCVVATAAGALLVDSGGSIRPLRVEGHLTAVGGDGDKLLLAAGATLHILDATLQEVDRQEVGRDVTALLYHEGEVWLGHATGQVTRLRYDDTASFDQAPWAAVVQILATPHDTVAVGFSDGVVGLWSEADGQPLRRARLHGAVAQMAAAHGRLHALSELGDALSWDLEMLDRDYCALLREIWREVPAVWELGRALEREPPPEHRCFERP